ncbi:MAG: dicarboxylate/amino acid:cation symporter [Planctomycetes bacterium]|nr:dicarboxylate/amino acid:cation symporter [Planctomycetota bacterium]
MKKLALHWWILIAMVAGVGCGMLAANAGQSAFVLTWIRPVGTLFMNLLKMIAVPLVLFSLVAGVASLDDMRKMGRIGGKTIVLYIVTTSIAITIGLIVAAILKPGGDIGPELAESLRASFQQKTDATVSSAKGVSMLDQVVGIVPTNPFQALAQAQMLQVVFFALMLGIALTKLSQKRNTKPIVETFQLLSDAIIEMVMIIMWLAPIGVFALLATVIAELGEDPDKMKQLLGALLGYMLTVLLGLVIHGVVIYGLLLRFVAKVPIKKFLKAMVPAQLLAFSSSSSGATLPVTINCVEKGIGVDEEVSSFVLPLGATINMDGTGLYQGVAAVFIATVYGMDLTFAQQAEVVVTASLASIGTAAVPGVGTVMLTIVLGQIGVPLEGIGLILGVDRILDMCRTVINVSGDATVACCVARSEDLIHEGDRTVHDDVISD